jgi:hypothetical protein
MTLSTEDIRSHSSKSAFDEKETHQFDHKICHELLKVLKVQQLRNEANEWQ